MTTDFTPKFDLAGKVVLVTGATRGIGRACALACAGSGADMILGVRSKADGAELTAEIERIGRRALAVQMDLTDLATVRKAVAEADAASGRIGVLVNNVGLGPENLAENVTEADFDIWIATFGETAAALFAPQTAAVFVDRAERIAKSLKLAMFFRLPVPGSSADSIAIAEDG